MVDSNLKFQAIGVSVPKLDALEKVTGKARYTGDIYPDHMLYGSILRSPYPHAKIHRINAKKAEKLPGVKAVVTWKDAPDTLIGFYQDDYRLFAKDKVRQIGDVVAAVAATDTDICAEALELIDVEYEELTGVFDPIEALSPDAPLVHDSFPGNIGAKTRIRKGGDIVKAFERAEFVFEDTFKTQMVEHCSIEAHMSVAEFDSSGKFTIYSTSQSLFNARLTLHRALQVPMSKIRIINKNVGGGFGGKHDVMLDAYSALLSKKSGCSVKIEGSREEEFIASTVRHPMITTYKTALNREGRILAQQIKIVLDFGAYNDIGEGVLRYATVMSPGPYKIEHVWVDGIGVYTNQQTGGAMRGIGVPQVCFASESQIDMIADRIGIDPYQLRIINAVGDGDTAATGQEFVGIGYKETLRRAKEESGYQWKPGKKRRGFGMASMIYACGAAGRHDFSSAVVRANEDGTFVVLTGTPDFGQGSRTTLAQIAAQEIGARFEDVWVDQPDTEISPVDLYGAAATRITYVAGNAVLSAAAEVKRQILKGASEKWEACEEDLIIQQGNVYVKGHPKTLGSLRELIMEMHRPLGETIIGNGSYHTKGFALDPQDGQTNVVDLFVFGTQIAEVEVDTETGKVKVLNVWAAHDVGKAVNPVNVEGQIEGGVQMGLGYALTEEIIREKGKTLNPSFLDYKMFTAPDMPQIHPIIIEVPEPLGPFGARGIGEPTTIPTAPAVANAVFDAVGVRVKDIPLTPERVLEELKKKDRIKKDLK